MSDVTVITCWNNEKVYNDFVSTLKRQTCPCEIIGIDNRGNKSFTSCAAAYNSVIDDVKTKYVIYSHQDILLEDSGALAKFVGYLDRIGHDDILGVAAVEFDRPGTITNIMHKNNRTGEIEPAGPRRVEGDMMPCGTVDECFFGGYTEHFRGCPFDASLCNNWHLYAAEACLKTQSKYAMRGGQNYVYVCDVELLHLSSGTLSLGFHYGFFRLCRHYAKDFTLIRTTCAVSRTDFYHAVKPLMRETYNLFKARIKRFIKICLGRK